MSGRRSLASGDVLSNRYELQDLVSEKLGRARGGPTTGSSTAMSASSCSAAPTPVPTTTWRQHASRLPSPIRGSCACST
ncbi:hypothetical protein [Aeromicrobium sp. UC242_57]|uniref:hypothetical protein n=1 Tax=Aeromicrobium sp. UC242_57 TaxID=3374624 RepID=UPI0037AFF761